MNFFLKAWKKLPPKWRYEFHSGANTIVAAMTVEFGMQVLANKELFDITQISQGLLIAVGLALVRAAWKALLLFILSKLGLKAPKPI